MTLGPIAFLSPWLLAGLLALPVIWWLLRTIPPRPRRTEFPPTRILVGSEDYATPLAMAEAMRDAIPGATLEVLDGAAHLTPLERPKDVARCLLELSEAAR